MLELSGEIWRPVPEFEEAYQVSDQGRVRSLTRVFYRRDGRRHSLTGRILTPAPNTSGHLQVALGYDGRRKMARVHRLVLETFVGPAPDGLEGCHNNGDHNDNRLVNLRWDSHAENMRDLVRHGLHAATRQTHCKYGHEFTPENTNFGKSSGARLCRKCQVRQAKEAYARRLERAAQAKAA